ncbi:MAG: Eco57I restriction-modification methylase domain-containing protein [Collinsella sp.]|nr:Eco57I restriction-modification methylase domain-containing protein [Collinsella sp.]
MTEADSETVAAEESTCAAASFPGSGFMEAFAHRYSLSILETLLCDRTTGRNIIWADNEYEALGDGYKGDDEITAEKITGPNVNVIRPRIAKAVEQQSLRTKSRAEVFSPAWLCNQMNNDLDEVWFGRRDVFNIEAVAGDGAKTWVSTNEPIAFPKLKGHGWHAYVEAPRLEITCGEAPFVCSRYDAVTGDELPVSERVGFLDRKLRVVTEKTKTRKEWVRRALDALRATYGFEYQGDNLLIARINVLETFAEHLRDRWGSDPEQDELEQAAWIVSWNFWQMNGLTDAVPTSKMDADVVSTFGTLEESETVQPSLFDLFNDVFTDETAEETKGEEPRETVPLCVMYDWQNGEPFEFATLKGKAAAMGKKFYAVIGNPPYQEQQESNDAEGSKKNYAPPIYNYFMDAANEVGTRVELIHPARFLFDAGSTPRAWNKKMLNDKHFKVLQFEEDSNMFFPSLASPLKGGIAITYHDNTSVIGPIGVFTKFEELNAILKKVGKSSEFESFSSIVNSRTEYRLTEAVHHDCPFARYQEDAFGKNIGRLSKGHDFDMSSNIFDRLPEIFNYEMPQDGDEYLRVIGRSENKRSARYVKRKYINHVDNLDSFKLFINQANGAGVFGETIAAPIVAMPGEAHTETFLSIGKFKTEDEACAAKKYLYTKFLRVLLGVLKVTQNGNKPVWRCIPLQDFTSNSDIDWSRSVADIDRQLYAKYGLDDEEIQFIESHVKEMN